MKVKLDAERCTGHGRCYGLAPELFDEDERGHCVLRIADPSQAQLDAARQGVLACPEQALSLEEEAPHA